MKKLITAIVIIIIAIVALSLLTNRVNNDTVSLVPPPPAGEPPAPALNMGFHGEDFEEYQRISLSGQPTIIRMTDSGFDPKTITTEKGATVFFVNEDEKTHWPATAIHPTHRVYKDSDIKNCQDLEKAKNMFDACKGIQPGAFYAFTFGEEGIWRFHDHLNSSLTGSITVE